jgi:anti-sigma factor RsiW
MGCEEMRELAPEIALGVLDGEQRAEALRHLATCADCRREVEQLSQVADELVMLAPVQEPPAGFESRVVEAIGLRPQPRRARRWTARRLVMRIGPALATQPR